MYCTYQICMGRLKRNITEATWYISNKPKPKRLKSPFGPETESQIEWKPPLIWGKSKWALSYLPIAPNA